MFEFSYHRLYFQTLHSIVYWILMFESWSKQGRRRSGFNILVDGQSFGSISLFDLLNIHHLDPVKYVCLNGMHSDLSPLQVLCKEQTKESRKPFNVPSFIQNTWKWGSGRKLISDKCQFSHHKKKIAALV